MRFGGFNRSHQSKYTVQDQDRHSRHGGIYRDPRSPPKKKTQEILIVLEAMGVPVNMPSNEFI